MASVRSDVEAWFQSVKAAEEKPCSGRIQGRVRATHIQRQADPIRHLSAIDVVLPGSFDHAAKPTLYGLHSSYFLPRANWSPITENGDLLVRGMAVDPKGVIWRMHEGADRSRLLPRVDDAVEAHKDDRYFVIGDFHNWYHFVLDYLPRLLALVECGFLRTGWRVAVGYGRAELFRSLAGHLGFDEDLLVFLRPDRAHYFPRAIYLSNFNVESYMHPLTVRLLRRYLSEVGPAVGPKKLYFSRGRAERRRWLGEEAIYDGLEHRGFRIVFPEGLDIWEQLSLCRGAQVIAGVHGAALTNMVWSQQASDVLEVTPTFPKSDSGGDDYFPEFQELARAFGFRHRFVTATPDETVSPGDRHSDFTIDRERFFAVLDAL